LGAWGDRPGDITITDACQFAVELEKSGVDVIDVSTGRIVQAGESVIPLSDHPAGTFVHLAEAVKRWVTVPVAAVGRIHTPEVAEAVLVQAKADLIDIGRQLIADPLWPNKVAAGQVDDIRPCLSCNMCIDTARALQDVRCAVNASACKEREYAFKPTDKPRK
jgi:2,4-dienoyl-CoA reductase-like NADH-dependent reductase (Old Yellow Enzyme family)